MPRQRINGAGRCASRDWQSAHRPTVSFARFSTALSRGAGYRPTQLRRTEPLVRLRSHVPPALRRMPVDRLPRTQQRFVAQTTAGQPKFSRRPVGQSNGRFTGEHHGVGGDRVSTDRPSPFRARPPRLGFGAPDPPCCRCGHFRGLGPLLRGASRRVVFGSSFRGWRRLVHGYGLDFQSERIDWAAAATAGERTRGDQGVNPHADLGGAERTRVASRGPRCVPSSAIRRGNRTNARDGRSSRHVSRNRHHASRPPRSTDRQ